jgi:subtilisin family serine protease
MRREWKVALAVTVASLVACTEQPPLPNDPDYVQAVYGAEAPTPGQRLAVMKPDGLPPPLTHQHALAFRARAEQQGSVRVIVRLRSGFELDGKLKVPSLIQNQRAEIGVAQRALIRRLEGTEYKVNAQYEAFPLLALSVDAKGVDELLQNENVLSIEEDGENAPTLSVSVPRIDGDKAWTLGYTGSGQTVAVLDTGVEKTHPMLTGKVISEACYGVNGTNGSIVYSSNCPGSATSSTAAGSGVNCATTTDGCEHGTHVAGIAAGSTASGGTYNGVAKSANIMAVQVFVTKTDVTSCNASGYSSPCTTAFDSNIISALQRVLTVHQSGTTIAAANLSLGGGTKYMATCDSTASSYKTAIDNLRSVNVATVIASGNSGWTDGISSPACVSTAISVGATSKTSETVASYSNSASFLSLLAPGSGINSSIPTSTYAGFSGTSMATPHVAGAFAIFKSAKSDLSVSEALAAFQSSGVSVTDSKSGVTTKRIDMDGAIAAVSPTAPTFSLPAGTYPAGQTVTITSATTGSSIRYTTDGSTPTSAVGTAIASGGTASVPATAASRTLNAVAYKAGLATSSVTSATYGFSGTYTVDISPQAAIDAGAKWRLSKGFDNFEDGALTRFTWNTSGNGTWAVDTSNAYEGRYAAKSPTITHNQSATLSTTIESDGGTLSFWYRTSTEATNDKLTFLIDGVSQGTYSGTTGWTQASFTLAAGSRTLTWTYSKNGSISSGSDAVWIDNISFPGDEWRASGATETGVLAGNFSLYFKDLADYVTPSTVSNSTTSIPNYSRSGTYTRKTGTVSTTINPAGAVTAGAQWRIDGGAWRNSGTSVSSINTGTHTIDFSSLTGWTTPSSQSITVSYNATTPVTGTYVQQQVATPTFGLSGGTYTTAQSVTLATTTVGATIRYTVDGSTPNSSSPAYSGAIPVPLNTTMTIRAYATLSGYLDSATASATYVVTGTVATPTFSVPAGTYASVQSVALSTTTSGATIYYTTDGSTPTTSSFVYSGAISVPMNTTMTIKAFAAKAGWLDSSVASASYVITGTVATPTFSIAPGIYTTAQTVALSTTTSGATLRYTTNNTDPTAASNPYTGPITLPLDSTTTLRVKAFRTDWVDSSVASGTFTITGTVAAPTISLASGTYTTAQTLTLATATPGASLYFTTDGSTPTSSSTLYSGALTVPLETTWSLKVIAVKQDWAASSIASANYVVTGTVATPTFSVAGGTYTTAQLLSLSTTTPGATIRYTTDGSDPTAASPQYTSPIPLPLDSARTVKARAFKATWTDSALASASYLITGTVAAPTFSLAPGIYITAQTVSLSTSTANATIRYTLDGSDPTTSSPVYTSTFSLPLDSTTALKARAFRTDWADSGVAEGTFTITGTVATPVLSLASGLYVTTQEVTITTATANAEIRYTTNGSTPTAASQLYTGPISLGLDTTTALRVRAFRTNWIDSAEVGADYTVTGTVATPQLSVPTGLYTTAQTVAISTSTLGADLRYTTDGSTPTASSLLYTLPLNVPLDSVLHLRVRAFRQDWADSAEESADITVTGTVATPTLSLPGQLYYAAQSVSIGCDTSGAELRYTLDGSAPTQASELYATPLAFPGDSETTLRVRAFKQDWVDSDITTATYRITGTVATPVANLASGLYHSAQAIELASSTANAEIRYTLDGTTPEDDASLYTGAINLAVPSQITLRARGFRTDWLPSAELQASYFVFAPLIVTAHGSGASGDVVESGQSVTIDVSGGSGSYTVTTEPDAGGSTGTVTAGANGTYVFTAPATGAFAGVHTVLVEDVTSGAQQAVTLTVPPRISVSRATIPAHLGTATVTITGGHAGLAFNLAVLDENGVVATGVLATIESKAVATDDAAHDNPATATLFAGDVVTETAVTVRATAGQLEAISTPVVLVPASTYRGVVRNAAERPIPGAVVQVLTLVDPDGQPYTATSSSSGAFELAVPAGSAVNLEVSAAGYLSAQPSASTCATPSGCTVVLTGETRHLRGTVTGLGAGEAAKLSLFYRKANGDTVEIGPTNVAGSGSGADTFEFTLDGMLPYERLDAKAFGFEAWTTSGSSQSLSLTQGDREGVIVALTPTRPSVSSLLAESLDPESVMLTATFAANDRASRARFELSSGDEFSVVSEQSLSASSDAQSLSAPVNGLTCGTTYRVRAVIVNDRDVQSSTDEVTFTTDDCDPIRSVKTFGCSSAGDAAFGALMLVLLMRGLRRRAART